MCDKAPEYYDEIQVAEGVMNAQGRIEVYWEPGGYGESQAKREAAPEGSARGGLMRERLMRISSNLVVLLE